MSCSIPFHQQKKRKNTHRVTEYQKRRVFWLDPHRNSTDKGPADRKIDAKSDRQIYSSAFDYAPWHGTRGELYWLGRQVARGVFVLFWDNKISSNSFSSPFSLALHIHGSQGDSTNARKRPNTPNHLGWPAPNRAANRDFPTQHTDCLPPFLMVGKSSRFLYFFLLCSVYIHSQLRVRGVH